MPTSNDANELFAKAAREAKESASEKQRKAVQENEAKRLAKEQSEKTLRDKRNATIESIWKKLVAFHNGVDVPGLLDSLSKALGVVCLSPEREMSEPLLTPPYRGTVRTSVVLRHPNKLPIHVGVSAELREPGFFTSWRIGLNVSAMSRDPTEDQRESIWRALGSAWKNDMARFFNAETTYGPDQFALNNDFSVQEAWLHLQLEKIVRDCAEYYASERK